MTRHVTTATWSDVPHLSEHQKTELLSSIPAYQRDARSKGVPQLGSGAIYPVAEETVKEEPFEMPVYWPRGYALDVGWNRTAAVFAAHDRETDTVHIYAEHYVGQAEPATHAAALRARGASWMTGAIDPASRGRSQHDGTQLMTAYGELGLTLTPADNGVESGLFDVLMRLQTGRLRVFRTCAAWFSEFRLYRRDERGKVVKERDHLMDATRYLCLSGLPLFRLAPDAMERFGGRRPVAASSPDPY